MKKVLFATTALVASAGIASAQGIALSGMAEMGVVGGDRVGDRGVQGLATRTSGLGHRQYFECRGCDPGTPSRLRG